MNSDRTDIMEYRKGNFLAFETLIKRYQKRVIGMAYQMLGDWEDAREASQDAFVKVYQAIHTFDLSRTFSTWLYRILINTCIDYRRRRDAMTDAVGITPLSSFYQDQRTPDQDVEALEHRTLLIQALEKLSSKHRAVITLRDLQGFSSREVSDIMDCSEAAVRVHLFHARRQLTHIDSKGRISEATLVSSLRPAYDDVALDTIKRSRFTPAMRDNRPVDAWMIVPVPFVSRRHMPEVSASRTEPSDNRP